MQFVFSYYLYVYTAEGSTNSSREKQALVVSVVLERYKDKKYD